ncbi:UNVERIFIED_CONTAM: hypothetical protein GTU68_067041 [Idotea baltica]|nr:hypothetical protein [Idotea baltica]
MTDIHSQKILILDFGSQYTQLIARRVREVGVYSEIRAFDMDEAEIREYNPSGIILAGGPESVTEGQSPRAPQLVFELGVPVLGICYGMQTMAQQLGGKVQGSKVQEFGYAQVKVQGNSRLLHEVVGKGRLLDVWMSHGDKVTAIPDGFELMASTESCPIAGMYNAQKNFYGIQFHPEVTHTLQGVRMFEHFVLEICGCEPLWTPAQIIDDAITRVRDQTFIDIFDKEATAIKDVKWLAQGTIYPDVIESAAAKTGKAHVIKSHHNVGGLPDNMKMDLVEPLRELFKDEVRKIGLELGLPYDMVYRHPFPGPGLGVRILGEVKKEYADILREADAIFLEELHSSGWYHKTSQAFVVFLPVKSVGVVGDARRYEYVAALRAVETIDFMTARWAHLPYELLEKVSNRIINEISGISRVSYDVSSKPPATIEWE